MSSFLLLLYFFAMCVCIIGWSLCHLEVWSTVALVDLVVWKVCGPAVLSSLWWRIDGGRTSKPRYQSRFRSVRIYIYIYIIFCKLPKVVQVHWSHTIVYSASPMTVSCSRQLLSVSGVTGWSSLWLECLGSAAGTGYCCEDAFGS